MVSVINSAHSTVGFTSDSYVVGRVLLLLRQSGSGSAAVR